MSSRYVSCAFYLRDHGVSKADLEGMPGALRGMDSHVVRRMVCDGVLMDSREDVYQDGSLRRVWKPGPCYGKVVGRL